MGSADIDGVTIDRQDSSGWSIRQQRGYFAGARYLHLSRYLEIYSSVFVADVYGHVSRDVAQMNAENSTSDVILSTIGDRGARASPPPKRRYSIAGSDFVDGGSGNDSIFASPDDEGSDDVHGGSGDDVIGGGAGDVP